MQYTSPHRKKRTGRTVLIIVLVAVVLLAAVGAAFWLVPKIGEGSGSQPADAYRVNGPASALWLAAPELDDETEDTAADAADAYFADAVAQAKANNINTLVFEGRTALSVHWEDKIFPADVDDAGVDLLGSLCKAADGQEIQLWVAMDPLAAGGLRSTDDGDAAALAKKLPSGSLSFDPTDEEYQKLLADSLARLPEKYPIAGVVLNYTPSGTRGDGKPAATTGTETEPSAETGSSAKPGDVADSNTATDSSASATAFAAMAAQVAPVLGNTTLGIATDASVDAETSAALRRDAGAAFALAELPAGAGVGARIAAFGDDAGCLVLDEAAGADATATTLFVAQQRPCFGGAVYGRYPVVPVQAATIGFLQSATTTADSTLPQGFDIPQTLQVNYPLETDTIGTAQETVFVMGNSDPALPLTLDGEKVQRETADGAFGVLVQLKPGKNTLTFAQGDEILTHTITRPEPPKDAGTDAGGSATGLPSDNTKQAEAGQAIQVTGVFAGALTDPHDDGAIDETFYGGAVAVVTESVRTVRYDADAGGNVNTWAYKLTCGDWVVAQNCAWIDGDGKSAFTGLSAETDPEGRGEWIDFEGTGTPAAIISCKDDTLSLSFCDTTFKLSESFASTYVQGAKVVKTDDGVRLDLSVQGIWGYQIDYTEGRTRLFLKAPPRISADPLQPLAGVRVMLDPGHGDQDMGAPGIMGTAQGPNEKDVNLALAQAIAYRLRQMGAEVTLLREGETFYTTHERLGMQIEQKPDFFLSVHHNSAELTSDLNSATGLQAYYHIPKSYSAPKAEVYAAQLMAGVAEATGRRASDVSYGYFNVTRTPVCPSVLFEFGFMISPTDFEDITSAAGIQAAACGAADGIYNTVAEYAPRSVEGGTAASAAGTGTSAGNSSSSSSSGDASG